MKKFYSMLAVFTAALVLSCSGGGNDGGNPGTDDVIAPTVGTAITVTSKSATGMVLSWGAATDETSAQETLAYRLVYSSANITTIDEANAANPAGDWAVNTTSGNLSSLTAGTTYFAAVMVRDEAGNVALYPAISDTTNATLSSEAKISAFTILGVNGTIDDAAGTIAVSGLPSSANLASLVANFTLSAGATAKVGSTAQVSGTTANDFSNPVVYTVTAEDTTTTKDYTVTVTKNAAQAFKIHFRPSDWGTAIDLASFKANIGGTDYAMTQDAITTWTVGSGKEGWYSTAELTADAGSTVEFFLKFAKTTADNFEIYASTSDATTHTKIAAVPSNGHIWVDRFDWVADPAGANPGYAKAQSGKVYTTAAAPNDAPNVTAAINGSGEVNEVLTIVTTYADSENDAKGTETYKWFGSTTTVDGTYTEISGQTNSTYTPLDLTYKFIKAEVTVTAATGTQPPVKTTGAVEITSIPAFATIDGTKDAAWSTLTAINDGADAWVTDGAGHTNDPCGFDFSKIYITNNANKLYIAIELSDASWGNKDIQVFVDNTSVSGGASDFGAGSSASWGWGDKNVIFGTGISIEALIHTWGAGGAANIGSFKYGSSLPLTQDVTIAEVARSADSKFIEISLKLSAAGLSAGNTAKIGITATNNHWDVASIMDSAFDTKLASPTSDQAITLQSYTIQ